MQNALALALAAVNDGNARNLGRTAMAKRWKAYFAAEDAARVAVGGWL